MLSQHGMVAADNGRCSEIGKKLRHPSHHYLYVSWQSFNNPLPLQLSLADGQDLSRDEGLGGWWQCGGLRSSHSTVSGRVEPYGKWAGRGWIHGDPDSARGDKGH